MTPNWTLALILTLCAALVIAVELAVLYGRMFHRADLQRLEWKRLYIAERTCENSEAGE